MANLNVLDILKKVYGARGLPFPGKPLQGDGSGIAGGFPNQAKGDGSGIAGGFEKTDIPVQDEKGSRDGYIKKYSDELLGRYVFLPVTIAYTNKQGEFVSYEVPNAVLIITGEKEIIETDIIDVGTVFEKVFTRPYDISIIATLLHQDGLRYPEQELKEAIALWNVNDVVTLHNAVSDLYLRASKNFIIKKISHLDAGGSENVEVIQIDGRSNIEFELLII